MSDPWFIDGKLDPKKKHNQQIEYNGKIAVDLHIQIITRENKKIINWK